MKSRIAPVLLALVIIGIGGCLFGSDPEDPQFDPDQPIHTLTVSGRRNYANSIFVSGDYIVSGHREGVGVWRLSTGKLLHTLTVPDRRNYTGSVFVSGDHIVSAHYKEIRVWQLSTGKFIRTLSGHTGSIYVSGDYIVSGPSEKKDKAIRIWRLSTGELVRTIRPMDRMVHVSLWGDHVLSWSKGRNNIKVWRLSTGELVRTLTAPKHRRAYFDTKSPIIASGDYVVSGNRPPYNSIRLWRLSTGELIGILTGHRKAIKSISVNGDYIVSGSEDETVRVWRLSTGQLVHTITGHVGWIRVKIIGVLARQAEWAVDMFFVVARDGFMSKVFNGYAKCLWAIIHTLRERPNVVTSVFASNDVIVSGSKDGTIKVWRTPW